MDLCFDSIDTLGGADFSPLGEIGIGPDVRDVARRASEEADSAALASRRSADAVALDAAGGMTPPLSLFYRDWFRPVYLTRKGVCAKTMLLYDQSVAHWCRLAGDPPMCDVDETLVDAFMYDLSLLPGRRDATLSPLTVKKHGRNLQTILLRAGPKCRGVRGCQGLIDIVPTFELPSTSRIQPRCRDFTIDELRAVVASANSMGAPKGAGDAPTFWRALVFFGYHTGLRITAMLSVEWEHLRDGWLDVPDAISKGRRGIRVPVHADALAAIHALPHRRGTILRLTGSQHHSLSNLRGRWRTLLALAGVQRPRRFGFHGLRKSCANSLHRVDPTAAVLMLGHATSVTDRHYMNRDDLLSAAVARMERIVTTENDHVANAIELGDD